MKSPGHARDAASVVVACALPWLGAGALCASAAAGATDNQGANSMEGIMGVLAVAGGFGLALGLTMLGMNAVLSIMPSRRRAEAPTVARAE